MATIIANTFSSYALTEEEQQQGMMLTLTQAQMVHNHRAIAAEAILALKYNPSEPDAFLQEDAYNKGYIAALTYLLDLSDSARAATEFSHNE